MTIALYAEFTATAGNRTLVTELIAEFAERVRAEPGNLAFRAIVMPARPTRRRTGLPAPVRPIHAR